MRTLLLSSLLLFGCEPIVGKACKVSDDCKEVSTLPDNANTICDPAVSCETLLCLGQGRGLDTGNVEEFCTSDCSDEEPCPAGFVCDEIGGVGPDAGRTVCLKP